MGQLIVDGIIDPEKRVSEYVPELADSGFSDARVIEVLDMTTALKHNEEYTNPDSEVVRFLRAASYFEQPEGYDREKTIRSFLPNVQKEGEHHLAFSYRSINTEVLSWIVEKATALAGSQRTVSELVIDWIWSKLNTEHEAGVMLDSSGTPTWTGGFTATTRDMARVGQMVLNNGKVGNNQLISSKVFEFMRQRDRRLQFSRAGLEHSDPSKKGWSYANQFWWTHNEHGAFTGIGIYGQVLYIDPVADMVVAKNSSHTVPEGDWLEFDVFVALEALGQYIEESKLRSKL